jgi:hypothetical protein
MRRWLVLAACAAALTGCGSETTAPEGLQPGASTVVVARRR